MRADLNVQDMFVFLGRVESERIFPLPSDPRRIAGTNRQKTGR
jgi:hypothetical protein